MVELGDYHSNTLHALVDDIYDQLPILGAKLSFRSIYLYQQTWMQFQTKPRMNLHYMFAVCKSNNFIPV